MGGGATEARQSGAVAACVEPQSHLPDRGRAVRRLTDTADPDAPAGLAIPELLTRKAWEEALWSFSSTNTTVAAAAEPVGTITSSLTKRPWTSITFPRNHVGSEGWQEDNNGGIAGASGRVRDQGALRGHRGKHGMIPSPWTSS